MRKIIKLLLTLSVLVIVAGAMGSSTVLALPPSSGTPTPISPYYGTIVLATAFTPSGTAHYVYVYIFSTAGPLYVEKVNVEAHSPTVTPYQSVSLLAVDYDFSPSPPAFAYAAHCGTVTPAAPTGLDQAGNIISVTPSLMVDPSGATAVPAASAVVFILEYAGCHAPLSAFPNTFGLTFEATVLAPTAPTPATVSICASESNSLGSCSSHS